MPRAVYLPQDVCATPLKMDGFVISRKHRICVGIELTVPMEHNISDWHQSKLKKYENELRLKLNGTSGLFTAASWKLELAAGYRQVWFRHSISLGFRR